MVKLVTILVIAFYASPSTNFFANKTFLFESFLVDVLDSLYVDQSVFLFEVTLGDPNCANIVHPNKMADWFVSGISCLCEIIIVWFLLPFA